MAWAVMAAVTLFVLRQLYPSLILRDAAPSEGDLAGHFYTARHLRYQLLSEWRLSGWSQDWFTGVPVLHFYFPLASMLVAFVSFVVPIGVALKLVAATGPVALPLGAYVFGRLNRCDRLTSACLAVSVLPLLLQPTLFLVGGSIAATVGGEYAYGLALALGLVVVGLVSAGLQTGRHRALAAGLLGAAVVLHLIVVTMTVVAVVVATLLRPARAKLRWTASVFVVAGLLAGFWLVPFLLRTQLTAGSHVPKFLPLGELLFPPEMIPILLLGLVAVVARIAGSTDDRTDLTLFMGVMVIVSGALFVVVPGGRVPNGRFLPVFFLWLCLLGGYGLSRLAHLIDEWRRERARGRPLASPAFARLTAPVLALLLFLPLYDARDWTGLITQDTEFELMRRTARTRFGGYERSFLRAESRDFVETMRGVARERGCGRVHAEKADGTWSEVVLALDWLLPYWTDGCLTTTHGYFLDASATSPYVTLVNSRVSPGSGTDLAAGIAGLRSLGVRYFVASHPDIVRAADASPDLRPVAETGTYTGSYAESYGKGYWKVYELSDVALVEPLSGLPVVVDGIDRSRGSFDRATEAWFDEAGIGETTVAAHGPASWPRATRVSADLPRRPVGDAAVSRVRVTHDRVSFDVSRTGVPVLVKVSYFPNWRASGAKGPWRVLPNQMVVVPTERTVTLRYGRTAVDHAGWVVTLLGVGGVVLLVRRGPVEMPPPPEPTERSQPVSGRPVPGAKRRKGKR
jgi:hypothetical protein